MATISTSPSIFNTIKNEYLNNFPTEMPQAACVGGMTITALHLLVGATRDMALQAGALTASVTIIEAVIRPMIAAVCKTIFPDENAPIARLTRHFTNMAIIGCSVFLLVPNCNAIFFPFLLMLSLNGLSDALERNKVIPVVIWLY